MIAKLEVLRGPARRIHNARRVERALRGGEGFAEKVRSLLAIPGHVVAPDGVMMRDRAAGGDQRVGGAGLDLAPLLDEPAGSPRTLKV